MVDSLFRILLVEDNPGDVRLIREGLEQGSVRCALSVVGDGVEAMAFLHQRGKYARAPRPNLILLDLNLPRKDGREVLSEIKGHETLRRVPVVVLTSSEADEDITEVYGLSANCYLTKPVSLDRFMDVVHALQKFWLTVARLPRE
jgi:chemotaxis family two-component system response regulator Rcp1